MPAFKDYSLYLVISEEYGRGRGALEIARCAIAGGVDIIQMREKHKSRRELLALGRGLCRLCAENRVTFIVNDDPFIARESGADGVHLGQEDARRFGIRSTREIIGPGKLIGISTHSPVEIRRADEADVDYIAYGPVFLTKTKDYFLGPGAIGEAVCRTCKPLVFIGGITTANAGVVLREGGKNIAMIRSVLQAKDITAAVRDLKMILEKEKGNRNEDMDKR